MTKLFIDTCVWLDLAKTSKGAETLNLLSEFIELGEVSLLLPQIVLSEFERNKERVVSDAGKSLSSHFKKVKEMVTEHIIAHSMGSLVTTLSLNQLRNTGTLSAHLDKIQQLILGAPDIDQQEFWNTILPTFRNIGKRRTIYASDHDIALWASSLTRANRIRLGQVGKDLFLDLDVETIEASNLKNVSPHSYLFESKQLLTDLFYLIAKDLNPADRRLREINSNILPYWLFLE